MKLLNTAAVATMLLFGSGCDLMTKPESKDNGETKEVEIGYIPIVDHVLVGVSDARDEFEGFDLEPLRFTNYPTMSEAVRSGDLDGAFFLAPLAFQMKASGVPIQIVLLGHRDGSGLVVDKEQNLKVINDLQDKTVAIPHRFSTNNFLMHYHAKLHGLSGDTPIDTVEAGPPEMFSALSAKNIDGYITAEPFLSEAEFSGVGEVMIFTCLLYTSPSPRD